MKIYSLIFSNPIKFRVNCYKKKLQQFIIINLFSIILKWDKTLLKRTDMIRTMKRKKRKINK